MALNKKSSSPRSRLLIANAQQRELTIFNMYRALEAVILIAFAFSPSGLGLAEIDQPIILRSAALIYLLVSLLLVAASRIQVGSLSRQAMVGLALDLIAAIAVITTQTGVESGVSLLLLFNIAIGALLIDIRSALILAGLAAALLVAESIYTHITGTSVRPIAETAMFAVSYLAAAAFSQFVRNQIEQSEQRADQHRAELVNLAEINELVIRRMRTGVLIVDENHRVRLFNEAIWSLLGRNLTMNSELVQIAPQIDDLLRQWRHGQKQVPRQLTLGDEGIEVLARFVTLGFNEELFLIFLDDARAYSGRAEELTLASLGRLSASIAHEIRNPLASINYAAQLLQESPDIGDADHRMIEIIVNQCQRMNSIVENILGLARRERSQPERIDPAAFARRFVSEYQSSHPIEQDVLLTRIESTADAMIDPRHLHQVLTALIANALTYGRMPNEPARVTVVVRRSEERIPIIEIIDRGPGIPAKVALSLFQPFFSTSEHGTGLGLYIARQLCEANQAMLNYESLPGGGACFRITLAPAHSLVNG